MDDEVIDDEAKAGPYRPRGPAQECDVLSTPRWQFALLGIWSIAYGVLNFLFRIIRGWLVLSFVVPPWIVFLHIPDLLMELGRAHRGVGLLGAQIPEVICGFKCRPHKGEPVSLGNWVSDVSFAWVVTAATYGFTIFVMALREVA